MKRFIICVVLFLMLCGCSFLKGLTSDDQLATTLEDTIKSLDIMHDAAFLTMRILNDQGRMSDEDFAKAIEAGQKYQEVKSNVLIVLQNCRDNNEVCDNDALLNELLTSFNIVLEIFKAFN